MDTSKILIVHFTKCLLYSVDTESKKKINHRKNAGNTILGRPEDNMLKWYGRLIYMEDNRWRN